LTGKGTGSDALRGKPTFPAIAGVGAARERASELARAGIEALAEFGPEATHLREFAAELVSRSR
jgi:geranylgeranyl pyrophosphate synthase